MADIADVEIFTALNVPAPGPRPSITCTQWSGDGQLIVSTKSSVLILTPDLGINFDNHSLLKTDRRNIQENRCKDPSFDLGWHRNLIELDKNAAHSWASETTETGAINLGSLDISWRSVAVSPGNLSNVSTGARSLLVIMNTNLELSLWCAAKNHLKEAWIKVQDITATLKDLPSPQDEGPQVQNSCLRALQAQVNCMAWSQQADFGLQPNPLIDGSILALGNRAGSIIFMRYDGERRVEPIRVFRITDGWVTHLAWGIWRSTQPLHSQSYLACGLADGSVVILNISQHLEVSPSSTSFYRSFTVDIEVEVLTAQPADSDGKFINTLAWIDRPEAPQDKPTLFHAKPGLFHFYRLNGVDSRTGVGEDLGTLRLQRQATSVDSSCLHPVVGLSRISDSDNDILIVALFDGTFHVVRDACTSPRFDFAPQAPDSVPTDAEARYSNLTSAQLSRLMRRTFLETEGGALRYTDVGRISGAIDFDGLGTILWLHEACRPTDFSYKHEAKHNSLLVIARLWQDPKDHDLLLRCASDTFKRPRSVLGHAPASTLRPILLHLSQRRTFDLIWLRLLPLLSSGPDESETSDAMTPWSVEVGEAIRLAFRRSLAVDLYGWDVFHSLRLRLAVADFCWKMSPSDEIRDQFGRVAQTLLASISHRFMKVLVKHLTAIVSCLTEQDLPFLMRVIVQSLLTGSPPDLAANAHALSGITKSKFTGVSPDAFGLTETCPACHSPIPLENLLTAICPRGHAWARCSITSFVLATPMVRTCSGCTRKAFLAPSSRVQGQNASNGLDFTTAPNVAGPSSVAAPLSSHLWVPDAGRSWIVDELLEAARCCLYCGNRFVRIL